MSVSSTTSAPNTSAALVATDAKPNGTSSQYDPAQTSVGNMPLGGMKSMSDYVVPKSSVVAERDTTASMTDIMGLPLGGQVISDKEQNRWLQSYMVGMQDKALDVNLQKESKLVDLDAQIKLKQMALHEKQIDADTLNKHTRAEMARAMVDVAKNPQNYTKKEMENIKQAVALQRSADGADIKTTSNTNFTQNSHLNEDTSNQNFNGNQQQNMTQVGKQDINASLNGNLSGVPFAPMTGLGMGVMGMNQPMTTLPLSTSLNGTLPPVTGTGTVPQPTGLLNSGLFNVPNGSIKVGA